MNADLDRPKYAVVPLNDLLEHDDYSSDCLCSPKTEIINGHLLFIHNSFDGREQWEGAHDV